MDAKELLLTRRSVRKYTEDIIPHDIMEKIIEVTKYAPSWKNFQIARYLINQISDLGVNDFVYNSNTLKNASNVCVLTYKKGLSGTNEGMLATSKSDWDVFDAGIATLQFCLSCHLYGVGTVIMGIIDALKISSIISLPDDEEVAALIVYGYPLEPIQKTPKRKENNEIIKYY
jgi:nitroreductase